MRNRYLYVTKTDIISKNDFYLFAAFKKYKSNSNNFSDFYPEHIFNRPLALPFGSGLGGYRVPAFSAATAFASHLQLAGIPHPSPPAASSTVNIEAKIRKEFIENWIFHDVNKYAAAKVFMFNLYKVYVGWITLVCEIKLKQMNGMDLDIDLCLSSVHHLV